MVAKIENEGVVKQAIFTQTVHDSTHSTIHFLNLVDVSRLSKPKRFIVGMIRCRRDFCRVVFDLVLFDVGWWKMQRAFMADCDGLHVEKRCIRRRAISP